MPNATTKIRSRLRPLVAALAFAIASGSSFAVTRERALATPHAPTDVVVENCNDSGAGSLREAYFNAVDGTTIDLTRLSCSTITLTSGALTDNPSAAEITLNGPDKYALTIDGGNANRVLVHNGHGTLDVAGLTIAHGSYTGAYGGGCIYSYGSVELFGSIVTGCQMSSTGTAKANGGAIYAHDNVLVIGGKVTASRAHAASASSAGGGIFANYVGMTFATISGNTVAGDGTHTARGGGFYALGDVKVYYSTISENAADSGAGMFLVGAATEPMQIRNSTISGNRAISTGGGVYAKYRALGVFNSTIALNNSGSPFGAGLYLAYETQLESSIVSGNTSGGGLDEADIGGPAGTTIIGGNNLVIASTLPLPADTITLDPMLGPLQNNGGYTATHALPPGSPAIDHGNNFANGLYDQRFFGYERVVGPSADIGAFEFGAPDHIFVGTFDS
ncbi:MAG TPA: choice-of-anchor Q domain-containing protein [Rhodanobacteraceae bacterium]|nr:choice-of-anchor Q domain-containing protein [Rhodanobacteraceae bacterium]